MQQDYNQSQQQRSISPSPYPFDLTNSSSTGSLSLINQPQMPTAYSYYQQQPHMMTMGGNGCMYQQQMTDQQRSVSPAVSIPDYSASPGYYVQDGQRLSITPVPQPSYHQPPPLSPLPPSMGACASSTPTWVVSAAQCEQQQLAPSANASVSQFSFPQQRSTVTVRNSPEPLSQHFAQMGLSYLPPPPLSPVMAASPNEGSSPVLPTPICYQPMPPPPTPTLYSFVHPSQMDPSQSLVASVSPVYTQSGSVEQQSSSFGRLAMPWAAHTDGTWVIAPGNYYQQQPTIVRPTAPPSQQHAHYLHPDRQFYYRNHQSGFFPATTGTNSAPQMMTNSLQTTQTVPPPVKLNSRGEPRRIPPRLCNENGDIRSTENDLQLREVLEEEDALIKMMTDNEGSRVIQKLLLKPETKVEEVETVFQQVVLHFDMLATDKHGSFSVQKLFDVCDPENVRQLGLCLTGRVLRMSQDSFGCLVLQKAIERLAEPERMVLIEEMVGGASVTMIKCQKANHVIQKVFQCCHSSVFHLIAHEIYSDPTNFDEVIRDKYGCRVLQTLLDCASNEQRREIVFRVQQNLLKYADDQYGNYVVQHIIERGDEDECAQIANAIIASNFVYPLSRQKFGSHVIERCLRYCGPTQKTDIVDQIMKPLPPRRSGNGNQCGESKWDALIVHQYGNYVAQRMLEVAKKPDHVRAMLRGIEGKHNQLNTLSSGKYILEKARQRLQQMKPSGGGSPASSSCTQPDRFQRPSLPDYPSRGAPSGRSRYVFRTPPANFGYGVGYRSNFTHHG